MSDLPGSSAAISAGWLNEVLDEYLGGGGRISAVETEIIGEGVGFVGEVARLTLSYDGEPDAAAPSSLISKMPTTNEGFHAIGMMLGLYQKEAGFYQEVAPEITVRIPRCYANLTDGEAHFILLLEDLAPMRPGNQLASATVEEARLALAAAAQLHARWWEHDKLESFSSWLPTPGSPYFEMLKGAYIGALGNFERVFGHLITPDIAALANRGAEDYERMMDAGVGRRPYTFVHGDFRLDNMMFGDGPETAPFALLDWQLPFRANPLWDVVYFLGGNFEPEWRRQHQDELVAGYHQGLVDGGVENYSLDQCREDYRAATLVLLGYLVTGANDIDLDTLNDRGREVVETMFLRYSIALTDLGAAEFLD